MKTKFRIGALVIVVIFIAVMILTKIAWYILILPFLIAVTVWGAYCLSAEINKNKK